MKLSATQFLQILDTLRSDPLRGRRGAPRVGVRFKATMVPCVEAAEVARHEVWVKDLSTEGVGFVFGEEMELGSHVVLQFAAEEGQSLSVLYRVTRCQRVGAKSVELGAKLERVLTAAELAG